MNRGKSIGLRADPSEAPIFIVLQSEKVSSTLTTTFSLGRFDLNHSREAPQIP